MVVLIHKNTFFVKKENEKERNLAIKRLMEGAEKEFTKDSLRNINSKVDIATE